MGIKSRFLLLLGVFLLIVSPSLFFSCGEGKDVRAFLRQADSLNKVSFDYRYKDLALSSDAAEKAFLLRSSDPTIWAQTLNNMGFCAFMRMDFEKAIQYYKTVSSQTTNEIECLVSDVGMMKICQRASLNKEFFDYRNQALRRMRRISADNTVMTDSLLGKRYNYALSEFYIVSGIYYYYLQQGKESLESIDAIPAHSLENDTAQWLYYMYMRGSGGMYEAPTPEDIVLGEFGYLMECLATAHKYNYIYFEANSLQAMAELLNFESNRKLLMEKRVGWMSMINPDGIPVDTLPLTLANHALKLFKRYGDWYQTSGTYRTIATYYNYIGKPELALSNLKKALEYVNKHHALYYNCNDSLDRLYDYREDIPYSIELKWVNDEGIKTVPEWVARLREQFSRTYSAMGMKRESDYNRNIYLDILDYTRQDKELESRYAALESEQTQLNLILSLVGLGTIVLIFLFFWLNRFWRKRYAYYLDELRMVLELCRKITAAVPSQVLDKEEVSSTICQAVGKEILTLTRAEDMWIEWVQEENESIDRPIWLEKMGIPFKLTAPGKEQPVATLWLEKVRGVTKDEDSLLKLIVPYLAWTLENGLNLASLSDERMRLEKEQYIHLQHLIENKCQNEIKKSCLAVVTGIVPYIDRVVNEIHKLQSAAFARDKEIKKGKLIYISELLDKINEYNDILAHWIKMRQGALSLNIENFALKDLFRVIAKGKRTFEMKNQQLVVRNTDAIVKADKALTLFMINTLTENARKYTPNGGRVEVSAVETEEYVEIAVTDNGPGLSEKDVHRILSEKVYDSGSIGLETAKDAQLLQKQKGHGFGLMNCKGIIDKYKKTNAVFSVCMFSITSELGQGSRFYFRLPKSIRKTVSVIIFPILLVLGTGFTSCKTQTLHSTDISMRVDSVDLAEGYDSLLSIANEYANKVYECNVEGYYKKAIELADSVLYYMNIHYKKYATLSVPELVMLGKDEPAELTWFANGFDTDYFILLDVRNEIAVASLAVKDFERYYYNNTAYTTLYKQVSEDNSLEEFCIQMQRSSNNKIVALTLFCAIILGCLVAYYLLYWRRRLHYRYNMEQVFSINRAAFSATGISGKKTSEVSMELVRGIFDEVNELVPINNLVVAIKEEGEEALRYSYYQSIDNDMVYERIRWCFERQEIAGDSDSLWYCLPLCVNAGGESHRVGVLALDWGQASLHEEDKLLVKLIASYLAVVLYNAIVQVERKYLDIELAQDEARRALFEENMLHVQNLVLDNCLSTIKHETIYYPNRIRQIAEQLLLNSDIDEEENENRKLADMSELVSYYKDIFTLLSSCAARQLDEITFRRSVVSADELATSAKKYYKKVTRKRFVYPDFEIEVVDISLTGDRILLNFLLQNLIDEAIHYESAGKLMLKISADEHFARFDFTDMRRTYSQDELNSLFYPDHVQIDRLDGASIKGTEYLVCKQIIREHDEFSGRRGCRINACQTAEGKGFTVWFTIPLQKTI